jgi:hypothetical protein
VSKLIPDEDEFYFEENGINKALYMSWINYYDEVSYELRVVTCDYDDPFDDVDRKNSKIQFTYKGKFDNCEGHTNKSKCRKRYNELVKLVRCKN